MEAATNYASLNIAQLTNLDGARGLNVPGARREEGVHATVFRAGDKTVIVTDPNTKDTVDIHYNADGSSTVTVNGEEFELSAQETAALDIHTGDGDDVVTVSGDSEGRGGLTLYTGSGNDSVTGGDGAETVYAGDGDDEIDTGRGNDAIYAGAGNDEIRGGHGHDTVDTGTGEDTVRAGSDDDITVGGGVSFVGNVTHGANISVERPDFDTAETSAAANEPSNGDNGVSAEQEAADESSVSGNDTDATTTADSTGGDTETAPASGTESTTSQNADGTADDKPQPAGGGSESGSTGEAADLFAMATESSSEQFEDNAEEEAGVGKSGNWLIALAKAQAKIQNFFLSEALEANETMAGLTKDGTASQGESGTDEGRAKFIDAQAVYQGSIQMFTTMTNITSTTLKTLGEGMAGLVRKQ